MKFKIISVLIICGNILFSSAQTKEALPFKAGAAKVNITPSPDALTEGYSRILDSLYTRAVVIDNGSTSAALISVDNGMLSKEIWKDITERIKEETGIPVENIFLSPSHSHSSPMLAPPTPVSNGNNVVDPVVSNYITMLKKAIVNVTKLAKSNLQPARIGFGTGMSYLNVNRDVIDPNTRLWTQGPNFDGPSDKTVAVIKLESLTGDLIAVYVNYAMHANMMYMSGAISAGLPGGVSSYIENYYKNFHRNNVIALWSMGASGDQNPLYFDAIMGDAMSQNTEAAFARRSQMINSVGQLLGEEVIRVVKMTKKLNDRISIYGSQELVSCPGRTRTNTGRQGAAGTYVDSEPVNIRLSLLMFSDIVLTATDGDCYNAISQRLKKEAPFANVLMASHTNGGGTGYIPTDDAYAHFTFQVLGSPFNPGCAENTIVNGLIEMMEGVK